MSDSYWKPTVKTDEFFILCGPRDGSVQDCLHMKNYDTSEGNSLIVDSNYRLDAPDDMVLFEQPDWKTNNSQLYLGSSSGTYLITWGDHNEIGIQHEQSYSGWSNPWRFQVVNHGDEGYAISGYKMDDKANSGWRVCFTGDRTLRNEKCKSNNNMDWTFRYKLIVPTSNGLAGIASNYLLSTTYDFIGMQVSSFPFIAKLHLDVIRELFWRSDYDSYKALFVIKVQEYKEWLDYYVPIYSTYSEIKNYRVNLTDVFEFRKSLDRMQIKPDIRLTFNETSGRVLSWDNNF
jgi:hypothetical protein